MSRDTSLQAFFETGQYNEIIAQLTTNPPVEAKEWRILGTAYLWSGQLAQAQLPLMRASELGDQEASVEYGNLLRLQGHFLDAVKLFETLSPQLNGELALRALRWWGTADFQAGYMQRGLERCEQAWRGYMARGDERRIGRVAQSLAQMYLVTGDMLRAQNLYNEALRLISSDGNPDAKLSVITGLANVQILLGDFGKARHNLEQGRRIFDKTDSQLRRVHFLSVKAEFYYLSDDHANYMRLLEEISAIEPDTQDFETRLWLTNRLADLYSRQGKHVQATDILLDSAPDLSHPAFSIMRGILLLRCKHYKQAIHYLLLGLQNQGLHRNDKIRGLLYLAEGYNGLGDYKECLHIFREALSALVSARDRILYRPDIQELNYLVQRALLDPELAPDMRLILDKLNVKNINSCTKIQEPIYFKISTLGRAQVQRNGGEVIPLSLEGSVLTLSYLALNPGRTRRELEAAIYPDRDPKTAGDYFRAIFHELRTKLNPDVLHMEGSLKHPRYSLGDRVHLDLDIVELKSALVDGNIARALALYCGPFLPMLRMESEWADEMREELRLGLTLEMHKHLKTAYEHGDLQRALLLANEYLRIDAHDIEVLKLRVDIARQISGAQELAHYVVALQRMQL